MPPSCTSAHEEAWTLVKCEGGSKIPGRSADQTIQIQLVFWMMHVKDSLILPRGKVRSLDFLGYGKSATVIEILDIKLLWEKGGLTCSDCSVVPLESQGCGCLWVPEPRTNQY